MYDESFFYPKMDHNGCKWYSLQEIYDATGTTPKLLKYIFLKHKMLDIYYTITKAGYVPRPIFRMILSHFKVKGAQP